MSEIVLIFSRLGTKNQEYFLIMLEKVFIESQNDFLMKYLQDNRMEIL